MARVELFGIPGSGKSEIAHLLRSRHGLQETSWESGEAGAFVNSSQQIQGLLAPLYESFANAADVHAAQCHRTEGAEGPHVVVDEGLVQDAALAAFLFPKMEAEALLAARSIPWGPGDVAVHVKVDPAVARARCVDRGRPGWGAHAVRCTTFLDALSDALWDAGVKVIVLDGAVAAATSAAGVAALAESRVGT